MDEIDALELQSLIDAVEEEAVIKERARLRAAVDDIPLHEHSVLRVMVLCLPYGAVSALLETPGGTIDS